MYRLNQKQLAHSIFPVGGLTKDVVRKIATQINLPNAHRSDSMGICFIGKKRFSSFISKFIDQKPGRICTENGDCVGEHNGLHLYTIGQRKGIGIGGLRVASSGNTGLPWFVAEKKVNENFDSVAFSIFPSEITDVIRVADNNLTMPPKSTWFDPKPLDGLVVYEFE